jgi:hypothetical protein
MAQTLKTYTVICANSTAQALDENVIGISSAWIASTSSLAVGQGLTLSVTAASPAPTQYSFAGTVTSPTTAITLGYSPTAGVLMIVKAVPSAGNNLGY